MPLKVTWCTSTPSTKSTCLLVTMSSRLPLAIGMETVKPARWSAAAPAGRAVKLTVPTGVPLPRPSA